ncbi:hypothetical protein [Streptomyces shenzhenensis]|uniref:hypothetical protein n=1 Tax=Streptomyces TaxID=1883 RepID=UPI001F17C33E|nr:hypothetical protein [Streptomyces shenzhenensis]
MDESNAKDQPEHPSRWDRLRSVMIRHLRKGIGRQGQNVSGEFLKGAAYKLGSGTVTLIIIWWETRH